MFKKLVVTKFHELRGKWLVCIVQCKYSIKLCKPILAFSGSFMLFLSQVAQNGSLSDSTNVSEWKFYRFQNVAEM